MWPAISVLILGLAGQLLSPFLIDGTFIGPFGPWSLLEDETGPGSKVQGPRPNSLVVTDVK